MSLLITELTFLVNGLLYPSAEQFRIIHYGLANEHISSAAFQSKFQTELECHTVLQKYAYIGLKQNLLRSITLDIITRLLDNARLCLYSRGGKIF